MRTIHGRIIDVLLIAVLTLGIAAFGVRKFTQPQAPSAVGNSGQDQSPHPAARLSPLGIATSRAAGADAAPRSAEPAAQLGTPAPLSRPQLIDVVIPAPRDGIRPLPASQTLSDGELAGAPVLRLASYQSPEHPRMPVAARNPVPSSAARPSVPAPFARRPAPERTASRARPQPPQEQMPRDRQRPPAQPEAAEVPSFVGNVEVVALDQLGVLLVRGAPQDVEDFLQIIEKIQEISAGVEPFVRVFQLHRASAASVRDTIQELYAGATGRTTTGATQPQAAQPQAGQQALAATQVPALKRFQIAVNERSNTLIVQASPQMMEELAELIQRLDVDSAPTVNEVRVFPLKNAQATELTDILNQAIRGAAAGAAALPGAEAAAATPAGGAAGQEATLARRFAVLRFVPVDGESRAIDSGILDEVRVTAQVRTNSILVSAPASSMDLLAAIIEELDKPPSLVATIKVFTLENSDATNMRNTLAELFDIETVTGAGGLGAAGLAGTAAGAAGQFQRPIAVAGGDQPPVLLRVAIDTRTNSLIVSGPENSVFTVEAIIKYIESNKLVNRKNTVYRLKNAQARDVADALTTFFTDKRTVETQLAQTGVQQAIIGPYQRLEQEVVVVALENTLAGSLMTASNVSTTATPATQGTSNMLLISASPRYYDDVIKMIEELDAPQPQVMIQVVMAQLTLRDDWEFGIEWGLQSSVLFDRGNVTTNGVTSPGTPGFPFNSTGPLGNSTLANPSEVGGQGLSNFSLGRAGIDSVGGLILTASSESVSALLRTLQINGHVEILSRPQIMTLDGRTAQVQVGEKFPYVSSVTVAETATIPSVTQQDLGIILYVKPSINPDGRIYLEVVPVISELRELINVQQIATTTGTIVQQAPRVSVTQANTVVSVNDGQTIVLGGLIQKRPDDLVRKIPWLGDLPYLGPLFRYTRHLETRQELLVILTPHIVRSDAEAQQIKEMEVARMKWILNEVPAMHGDLGMAYPAADCDTPELLPPASGPGELDPPPAVRQMSAESTESTAPNVSKRQPRPGQRPKDQNATPLLERFRQWRQSTHHSAAQASAARAITR
jgi:type II secretion system protein D